MDWVFIPFVSSLLFFILAITRENGSLPQIGLFLLAAAMMYLASQFATFQSGTITINQYAAYNVTTSNVPLYCTTTASTCGTTTEITQYPARNVTTFQTQASSYATLNQADPFAPNGLALYIEAWGQWLYVALCMILLLLGVLNRFVVKKGPNTE